MASRGARKAAQNKKTKAAHAQSTKKHWDDLRGGEKVGWGDVAKSAAGAVPFVGGAIAAADVARGLGTTAGSAAGAAGDAAEAGGKAGLKAAGKAAAKIGAVAGIAGAVDAAVQTGKLLNKMQAQNMTDEQYAKHRSRGSGRAATRKKEMGNSPMNYNSPLDYTIKNMRGYGAGPNYVDLSKRIGESVDQAVDDIEARKRAKLEEEERIAERARREQMMEMQQLQLANLKSQQYETLTVAGDTNIPSADQYLQGASRALVDKQAALVADLKAGKIDTDKFAQQTALIKQQVPQLKAAKEGLVSFQGEYQKLLESGEMSAANDGMASQLYGAITSGDMNIGPDEEGVIRVTNKEGTINLPISDIGRIPQPIKKAEPIDMMVNDISAGMTESTEFGEQQENAVKSRLDQMLSGNDIQNNKFLKSVACDSLGMSLAEANALMDQPVMTTDASGAPVEDNTYVNALEQYVEDQMIAETRDQWKAKRYELDMNAAKLENQQLAADLKRKALQQSATPSGTANKYQFDRTEMNQNAAIQYRNMMNGLNNAKPGTTFQLPDGGGQVRQSSDGRWIRFDAKGEPIGYVNTNEVTDLMMDAYDPIARQYAQSIYSAPTKRLANQSPLNRLVDWFRGK